MSNLDPVLHAPHRTGPTRDMRAITAREPVYRQEHFQLMPKRLPVHLTGNMKPRPRARSGSGVTTPIAMSRVPVLVRTSNQKPLAQGTGVAGEAWNVSDPGAHALAAGEMMPGMGALERSQQVLAGLAVGVAAWFLLKRKR